ncbi:carbohydrate kinase [Xylanimonas oleitrophica]|uniref:Carbohydrate kinase n=1 Tax=Xylanimonas oleitrophica TaxID=2607479 RepID=A0A2W5WR00_9MICO|nr:carbohydrate kinase [Xylanimonas oleitrophica]PZR53747.1 carbohydrate kinase [Xylanimonas oleitrophica]
MTSPAHDVLVVGESVADVLRRADGTTTTHPGGSPANVAYGLARLGTTVAFLTQLGADADGDLLRAHQTGAGVVLTAETGDAASDRTSRATAHIGPDGSARYAFDLAWTLRDVPRTVQAGHVHTGSVALFLAPGADAVARLVAAAHPSASISVDPNVRPDLLHDRAEAVRRFEAVVPRADLVKASDEDLAWLYPGRTAGSAARHLVAAGAGLVVVTRGQDGALAATRERTFEVPAVATRVADTVGAGDSFMAALLDGLRRASLLGPAAREALRTAGGSALAPLLARAALAASVTVSRPGADLPTAAEVAEAEVALRTGRADSPPAA